MADALKKLLDGTHESLERFLEARLPVLGARDWWKHYVVEQLTTSQRRNLEAHGIEDIAGLDLAALLRVFDRNWSTIAFKNQLPRENHTLVNEVRNIRNREAHRPGSGIPLKDQYRFADTLLRFLEMIGADDALIEFAKEVENDLLAQLADAAGARTGAPGGAGGSGSEAAVSDYLTLARPEEPPQSAGVPVGYFGTDITSEPRIASADEDRTFIGIDFGTSTTVVSIMRPTQDGQGLIADPLPIPQIDEDGRTIESHLVPTCIAALGERILIGQGAARLKSILRPGVNIWSSFKMLLGVDLGPQYPDTVLSRRKGGIVIESPQDAASVFFEFLRRAIEDHVEENGLGDQISYSISVPAAFEANQREDLMNAVRSAGIPISEACLIDEPNAAFLSYLAEMQAGHSGDFLKSLVNQPRNVLVFDFGAGTCDISILRVEVQEDRVSSRNLALSRFMALGGDDIDRAIARSVLLPQLCKGQPPESLFTTNQLETLVLPALKGAAEQLKIKSCKQASTRGWTSLEDLQASAFSIEAGPIESIQIDGKTFELSSPSLTMEQFAEVMGSFLEEDIENVAEGLEASHSVFEPVASALEKAEIDRHELNMVLFIGGSSENPLVRAAIGRHFGRFVECQTPNDLRSHVSQGAAIHSLFVNGFGLEPIRPITSEPIYVVARGGVLQQLVPAGTVVPSETIELADLVIDRDGQERVDLPVCVSGADKILGTLTVTPSGGRRTFQRGQRVEVACEVTRDKLLKIHARVGEDRCETRLLNPLANQALSDKERALLRAQLKFNESRAAGDGRPEIAPTLAYAKACEKAGRWRLAAELYEAVERLDGDADHATSIAYAYSRDGDMARTDLWSARAYERAPCATTAYNFALAKSRAGDDESYVRLLRESLARNASYDAALTVLGHHLLDQGDASGMQYLERACELYSRELEDGVLRESDFPRARRVFKTLGRSNLMADLERYVRVTQSDTPEFDEENLAAAKEQSHMARAS